MSINEQELKIIRSDIQDLKAEISLLNQNFSALEELMRLIVANQTSNNVEIKNFNEHSQQLQKAIDAQKLNHRLYFDNVENSLSALKILLENTLSPKISAIEKSIDAESQNNSLNNKTISSLEELMRLIVANQMLNNLEIKKPPKQEIFVEEKPEKRIYSNGEANIVSIADTKIRLRLHSGCIERGNTFTFYGNNYIVRRLFNSLYKETDREVSTAYCYIEVIDFGGSLISSKSFSVGETIKFYRR